MSFFQARTDLALEAREYVEDANGELRGVIVEEYKKENIGIHVTKVQITTQNSAKLLGKPKGTYITLEVPGLCESGENSDVSENHEEIAEEISEHLRELLPKKEMPIQVLVVGLGNRDVTADALGPAVAEHLYISRHMLQEFGELGLKKNGAVITSCIVPGVMAKQVWKQQKLLREL